MPEQETPNFAEGMFGTDNKVDSRCEESDPICENCGFESLTVSEKEIQGETYMLCVHCGNGVVFSDYHDTPPKA